MTSGSKLCISRNRRAVLITLGSLPIVTPRRSSAQDGAALRGDVREALGPRIAPSPQLREVPARHPAPGASDAVARLFFWNQVALDTIAVDHTPVVPGQLRIFGEQFGPTRTSRALAIIHLAILDAVNAIGKRRVLQPVGGGAEQYIGRYGDRSGSARHAGRAISFATGRAGPTPRDGPGPYSGWSA